MKLGIKLLNSSLTRANAARHVPTLVFIKRRAKTLNRNPFLSYSSRCFFFFFIAIKFDRESPARVEFSLGARESDSSVL